MLCGTTQLLFFRGASRAPSLPMGSTSFPIHRLLQRFGRSRAAIAALFCHQHSIFCANLQGKPLFCTKVLRFQQKISSIFYSMTGQAHLPGRRSFCLFLCRSAGKVLVRLEAAGATPSVSSSSIPSFFCYYNRTARQIPWPASFPAFFEQYWKARGVRRGPFPFPFYALFPFFAQCRVMLETMALSSSAV